MLKNLKGNMQKTLKEKGGDLAECQEGFKNAVQRTIGMVVGFAIKDGGFFKNHMIDPFYALLDEEWKI